MIATSSGIPSDVCAELRKEISASDLSNRTKACCESAVENLIQPLGIYYNKVSVNLEVQDSHGLLFNFSLNDETS